MNNKKKVLLSSIMTIVLCACLIAGSTFALFTSDDEFDISITSGKVNIDAFANLAGMWSATGADAADDEYLIDENGNTYTHYGPLSQFINGGIAYLDGDNLKIDRITPGDKVAVNIKVTNNSNVAISYRYHIEVESGDKLASGMVVTVDDVATEGLYSYTSAWSTAVPGYGEIADKVISVELPVYAGNEYQEQSCSYKITVEAVQGNAVTTNEAEIVKYATNVEYTGNNKPNAGRTPNGGIVKGENVSGQTVDNKGFRALYITSLTDDLYILDSTFSGTYAMNVNASNITEYGIYAEGSTFNGWTSYGSAKEVVFTDCSFGEAEGYKNLRPYVDTTLTGCDFVDGFTITCNEKASNFTITLDNCTVNGVDVTADNFVDLLAGANDQYSLHGSTITVIVNGVTVRL